MTAKTRQGAGMESLIQRKGDAQRPQEMPQRGEGNPQPLPLTNEPKVKAMTLKLTERDYERLLRAGIKPRRTNQEMMEEAVLAWLDRNGF